MPQEDKTIEDVMSEPKEVVRKIRFLIDTHHETVPGLARGVGVLPNTIQDVLDGQSLPSSALVRRIAQRFALPVEFFSSEVSRDPRPKRSVSARARPCRRNQSRILSLQRPAPSMKYGCRRHSSSC